MAEKDLFEVEIICPDHPFYEGQASMIEFNTSEGQVGIYKNHVPETLILRSGIVTITTPGEKLQAALHSGFAEVLKEKVTIMAQAAEWPREIDLERARKAESRARERLGSSRENVDVLRAEMALNRALTRIGLMKK